jgi:hypothetical protein
MSHLTRGIRSKSPHPPFSKGEPGGISEIWYHSGHNFTSKRLTPAEKAKKGGLQPPSNQNLGGVRTQMTSMGSFPVPRQAWGRWAGK